MKKHLEEFSNLKFDTKESKKDMIFDYNDMIAFAKEYHIKQLKLNGVVKSLPTEQCARDWWKEDGGDSFWNNETNWSNEEVFKEIYKALTYFIKTWQ